MKRLDASISPASHEPCGLTGGSAGDIPLTSAQLAISFFWWGTWAAVCVLAACLSPVQARTVAWAAAASAAAPQASSAPDKAQESPPAGAPEQRALQSELETLLKAPAEQMSHDLAVPKSARPRVEVLLGRLDPRLKLAPCDKIRAFLPPGTRLWGHTRVGLRCEQGVVRWSVYWPVTVKVWAPAVVAVVPLRPGTVVTAADLRLSEVDLAESNSPAVLNLKDVIGRSVVRLIDPGQGLRADDVRMRRWFAAGDPVWVIVKGQGFSATSEGLALSHGDEGQCARVRVESGRVLCARPIAERRAEITL